MKIRIFSSRSIILATISFQLMTAVSLLANPVLDQSNNHQTNTYLDGQLLTNYPTTHYQQGVTSGLTGQLTGIDLSFSPFGTSGPVSFGINLGAPWQTDADDFIVTSSASTGWNFFDLTAGNIFLTAGQAFTIDFLQTPLIDVTGYGPYAGGEIFYNGTAQPQYDALFRTYVDQDLTGAVPDTTTSSGLLLLGLVVLAPWRRKLASA